MQGLLNSIGSARLRIPAWLSGIFDQINTNPSLYHQCYFELTLLSVDSLNLFNRLGRLLNPGLGLWFSDPLRESIVNYLYLTLRSSKKHFLFVQKSFANISLFYISFIGSGALSGLMLDLGLLKIICEEFFSYFQPMRGTLTLRGPILILFITLQNKANPYLT